MRRIGLLGGSFNPAHGGHLHISALALDILGLDGIWWLVSPGNPLKPPQDMAPFEERMESAKSVAEASGLSIHVSSLEREMGFRYSIDTLYELKRRHPKDHFVWIMGADNLIEVHRWKKWRTFFRTIPIAVFQRPAYSLRARAARAAKRFANAKKPPSRAKALAGMTPPAWIFPRTRRLFLSSTRIRQQQNKK